MEMPEITITEAYNLSQLKIAELERIIESLRKENEELKAKLDKAKDALEAVNEKSLYVPAIVQEALLEIRGKND